MSGQAPRVTFLGEQKCLHGGIAVGTVKGMSEEKRRPGRPATGETPARKMRVEDDLWNETERLAGELAELNGAKRNVTAYVKEALRRENARVERLVAKARAEQVQG